MKTAFTLLLITAGLALVATALIMRSRHKAATANT